jgi:hypothetical protein
MAHGRAAVQRHSFTALNSTFVVDSEYQFVKELGQGAYGCVVAAKHRGTGDGCAIKKITNINTKVCGRVSTGGFGDVVLWRPLFAVDAAKGQRANGLGFKGVARPLRESRG